MPSVWVHEFRNGTMTGSSVGGFTDSTAREWIDGRRRARDTDPVWAAFRDGYDWHTVEFDADGSGKYAVTY